RSVTRSLQPRPADRSRAARVDQAEARVREWGDSKPMIAPGKASLERSGKRLANSAEKIKHSTYRVEDNADRTTQLAADRTVFAAERSLCSVGTHRSDGRGKRHRGEGAARRRAAGVADCGDRQLARPVPRVLLRRRSLAPSLSRRAATPHGRFAH